MCQSHSFLILFFFWFQSISAYIFAKDLTNLATNTIRYEAEVEAHPQMYKGKTTKEMTRKFSGHFSQLEIKYDNISITWYLRLF